MSISRNHFLGIAAAAILGLSACGGTNDPGSAQQPAASSSDTAASSTDPCSITSPATIQKAFGGTAAKGKPGNARNCEYAIAGRGSSTVVVFYYGSATEFDGIKSGYDANRGPLTDVPGIGEQAFAPGDVGENEVVALAGDTVFAVGVNAVSATSVAPEVKKLASLIAAELS